MKTINKDRINYHNKDTRIKIGLLNHANLLLMILGIDEEIDYIEEKDLTTVEGKNLKLDFRAKLKSGKQLNVEGESGVVQFRQLRKTFNYSKELYCLTKKEVISIIMALAEGNNKRIYDEEYCNTFKPYLLETKKYNGEKYLNIYKDKVENKEYFTQEDCGIIDLIPEMKFNRDMSGVICELCEIVKNGLIPEEYQNELKTIMNLSIDYYVDDESERKRLTEMLKMDDAFESEFNRIIRESKEEGKINKIRSVLDLIYSNMDASEIGEVLENELKSLEGK